MTPSFKRTLLVALALVSPLGAQRFDIKVGERSVVQRCLIQGPSTRMIAVGNPHGRHYAFDALHCAPVYVWSGGFVDFKGEANSRGGTPCKILGLKQELGTDRLPLRVGVAEKEPEKVEFHGYRREAASGEPTFLFSVDGVAVEQSVDLSGTDQAILRFTFPEPTGEALFYRIDRNRVVGVELSEGLTWEGGQALRIPAGARAATITLRLKPVKGTFVRNETVLSGQELYALHCNACHSVDGSKMIGPSFKGLWGGTHTVLRDGKEEEITVDEAYLVESIVKPQAVLSKGYPPVPMPSFERALSKKEIRALVDFIATLE
ncbi:MAG: c-type cytochrome [Verrucomicrobiales bacterium]